MEVYKEYEYVKNGKTIRIKRKYEIKGIRAIKQNELDEYFKNNAENMRQHRKLKDVLTDYNNSHDNKISYSMLYTKYKTLFGKCKKHEEEEEKQESD